MWNMEGDLAYIKRDRELEFVVFFMKCGLPVSGECFEGLVIYRSNPKSCFCFLLAFSVEITVILEVKFATISSVY